MKRTKLILGLFLIFLSINLVFAAASRCSDTDAKEKEGVYPRGMNYYQKGLNSGENLKGSWSREDFCKGKNLYEFYCYYANKQYYNGTAIYKCKNGCNINLGSCNPVTSATGKSIDLSVLGSSTGMYLGILVIIIIIIALWFVFKKKKRKR